jgi:cbb3-type cytochrome oxidase subunit 3
MLVQDKKHMTWGVVMTIIFVAILAFMFSKNFQGRTADEKINAFEASDNLFNSIAKGSTNYFPMLLEESKKYMDHSIDMTISLPNKALAERSSVLLQASGAEAQSRDTQVFLKGNLGRILETVLQDSRMLFNNEGQTLQGTYDLPGKEVVYVWWNTMDSLERSLTKASDFKAAKFVSRINKRGVEVGYNFYGIPSQSAADKAGILSFSLVFYVLYTLWWGFAIFFLFEGLGLRMSSGAKKEV